MRWRALVCSLSLGLALCTRGTTRHAYHVTEAQMAQMAQIAGITPCASGRMAVIAGLKRAHGGGVLYVECLGPERGP